MNTQMDFEQLLSKFRSDDVANVLKTVGRSASGNKKTRIDNLLAELTERQEQGTLDATKEILNLFRFDDLRRVCDNLGILDDDKESMVAGLEQLTKVVHLPSTPSASEDNQEFRPTDKKCPSCGATNYEFVERCVYCFQSFSILPSKQTRDFESGQPRQHGMFEQLLSTVSGIFGRSSDTNRLIKLPGRFAIASMQRRIESIELDKEEFQAVTEATQSRPHWMQDLEFSSQVDAELKRWASSNALEQVAEWRLERGDFKLAAETCIKALAYIDTEFVYLRLAEILATYGDISGATECLKRARARWKFDADDPALEKISLIMRSHDK